MNAQLKDEVEAWLASNEVTVLPFGFSNFKDGIIPKAKGRIPVVDDKARDQKIEQINKEIRATRKNRSKMSKEQKQQVIAEQSAVLCAFYEKAGYGSIAKLSRVSGVSKSSLNKAKQKDDLVSEQAWEKVTHALEHWDYSKPILLHRTKTQPKMSDEQKQQLLLEQSAVLCAFYEKAGYGSFVKLAEMVGITAKAINNTKNKNAGIGVNRWQKVVEAIANYDYDTLKSSKQKSLEAIAAGKDSFMSTCRHHGWTEYLARTQSDYRCKKCLKQVVV